MTNIDKLTPHVLRVRVGATGVTSASLPPGAVVLEKPLLAIEENGVYAYIAYHVNDEWPCNTWITYGTP